MRSTLLGLVVLLCACAEGAGAVPPSSGPGATASAPAFERRDEAPLSKPAPAGDVAPAKAPAPEEAPAEPPPPEGGRVGEGGSPDAPVPDVEVKNVGMHIGGEENTADQKRPIREAVSAHYDAMRRCWASEGEDAAKTITFGIDMRIDGQGGVPKVSSPRSGFKNADVAKCLEAVFAAIEFPPQPNKQPRMVSFSIEFRKK
jgi:hypothetical protein